MRKLHHIFRLLLLVAVFVTSVVTAHAQRPDSRSFEHLWTLYDGINPNYVRD